MKKLVQTIAAIAITLVLSLSFASPVMAASEYPLLIDQADLLSDGEEAQLLATLNEISARQHVDLAIATVNSMDGMDAESFADYTYEALGYGQGSNFDGAILIVSMEYRDWAYSGAGYMIYAITDAGQDYISDQFVEKLSDGDYYEAFDTYARLCDDFITQARSGQPYDVGHMPKEPFPLFPNLIISIVIALLIALIVNLVNRSKLKSVAPKNQAADYVVPGSLHVTGQREIFLYRNVVAVPRSQNNGGSGGTTTHVSSGGMVHSGSHGKF